MQTHIKTSTRFAGAFLATIIVALAVTVAPAIATQTQAGPDGLATVPEPSDLTAWVTIDCDDLTDPLQIHVTNNSDEPKSVEIGGGSSYGWALDPGETRQGSVWFATLKTDWTSVQVSEQDGPVFFSQVIPFDHSCFGASPDYSLKFDCATGVASVVFTNESVTPTYVGVVYPPESPDNFVYVTHLAPVEMVLAVSPGETVDVELYGDGHVMFNGEISFDCEPAGVTEITAEPPPPPPDPNPTQLKWLEYLVRQLRIAVRWMALTPRF